MLSWLLDEPTAPEVRRLLGAAEVIIASDLTLIECDRVLLRAVALKELTEAEAADRTSSRQRLIGKFCESSPRSSIARVSRFRVTRFGHLMPSTLHRFSLRVRRLLVSDF